MSLAGRLSKAGINPWGDPVSSTLAGTSGQILVLLRDRSNDMLIATGTDVPANATSGYAKGCLFIDRNVVTGTTGLYENIGTNTSCNFNAIGAVTAGEIALAQGSVLIGNAAGAATALAGEGDAKILVGNGTTMTSVSLSGDATITNAGVVTVTKSTGDFQVAGGDLDAGSSGVAGTVDIFPSTAARGKLSIRVGDQTGDTTVIQSFLEMGQATTIAYSDPGEASAYVAMSTAALSLAEMDVLQGATAGTQVASKAVIADANVNTGVAKITALHIGASGAETQVTADAAELNILDGVGATAAEINFSSDVSAQTETVTAAGAVSVLLKNTNLELVGAGAVTLAAPNSIMTGQIKTIRMTVDNGDVTMALTEVLNVAGASAGTTLTFDAVGDTAILVACGAKWTVIGVSGAAIT